MPAMTIRKLSEETHRALKRRAKQNGRSAEAEARAILDESLRPEQQVGLGTAIHELARKYAVDLAEIDFDALRDKTPAGYVDFSGPEFDRPEFDRPAFSRPAIDRPESE